MKSASAAAIASTLPTAGRAAPTEGMELLMKHDGVGLGALVRSGEVKPRELVEATIQVIETLDEKINAIPVRDFERALDRADSILPQGPFAGVPFSVKDTANVAGLPTAVGNKFFANRIPKQSHGLVRLYEAAGLIVVGKSNLPDMSLIPTTEGGSYGTCRNPWNLDYSTGGSSGGAGASVAAGYTPLAHGTDGAGSIRIPASHCGVFGLKPGRDRILSANSTPRFAFDHVLSRTVRDSALSLAVTQDRSPDIRLERMGFIQGPSVRRLKIGYLRNGYTEPATPDVVEAIDATARLCEGLGHEVIEAKQIIDRDQYEANYIALYAGKFLKTRKLIEKTTGQPVSKSGLMTKFTARFGDQAEGLGSDDLDAARRYFDDLDIRYNSWLTSYDVVLSPVTYAPPPRLGFLFDDDEEFEVVSRRVFDYLGYTSPQNVLGLPSMSVPLHISKDGLPIGSHFATKYGQEPMLLELAYELEAAQPWAGKWAPKSIASL